MVLEDRRISLIGAGVMAEMLAQGLVRSKLVPPENIMVSHYRDDRLREFAGRVPVQTTTSNTEAYLFGDVCVLCVRPQAMTGVLREIRQEVDGSRLLSSIAAGLPISLYETNCRRPCHSCGPCRRSLAGSRRVRPVSRSTARQPRRILRSSRVSSVP